MEDRRKILGQPNIQIAGLKIWFHRRQSPDSVDYWDGNWVHATAICNAQSTSVSVSGNFIHLSEIVTLKKEAESLYESLAGKAELNCLEPELSVLIEALAHGQMKVRVNITPDHLNQKHEFNFEYDQSYLPELISCCKKVLERFPVLGKP